MNANELADKAESMKKYGYTDGWIDEVATMLRQQQAEIETEKLYSSMKHDEVLALKAEIEALKEKLDNIKQYNMDRNLSE